MTRRFALTLLAVLLAGSAAEAATLRPHVEVTSEYVTIGDLFDGAGAAGATPIFRAPALGVLGSIAAADVVAAATAAGLADADAAGLAEITVLRLGFTFTAAEIEALLRDALADRLGIEAGNLALAADGIPDSVAASATSADPLAIAGLSIVPSSGRFEAVLAVDVGGRQEEIRVSGTATETIALAVLTRPLARGDIVVAADLTLDTVPRRLAPNAAVVNPAALVGMAAGRALGAGDPLLAQDFAAPLLVQRNELVLLVYQVGSLSLSAQGRALASGAAGDLVSVVNEQSSRIVQGVVDADGTVRVSPAAPALTIAGALP